MILCGDCLDVMQTMEDNSIDAIVTDPPYGLKFMNKEWDRGIPGLAYWEEALRVSKPGTHMLVFGGTRTYHRLTCAIEDAGWEIRDCLMWLYGSGFPKSHNLKGKHAGKGTALKPAWEPVILARKPIEGTVADNVQEWGTGGLNIDGGRIGSEERPHIERRNDKEFDGDVYGSGINGSKSAGTFNKGRWPANLLLDETAAEMLDEQSGTLKSGRIDLERHTPHKVKGNSLCGSKDGSLNGWIESSPCYADSGGASRFFYCAKASPKERGEGNNHPTVKPLSLMKYLIKLITPPGGKVLDPFAGSGSTIIAATECGFDAIGIEINPDYVNIATSRIGVFA